jgi:hypothetical protein
MRLPDQRGRAEDKNSRMGMKRLSGVAEQSMHDLGVGDEARCWLLCAKTLIWPTAETNRSIHHSIQRNARSRQVSSFAPGLLYYWY